MLVDGVGVDDWGGGGGDWEFWFCLVGVLVC